MTASDVTARERDRLDALRRRHSHLLERLANWNPARDPSRTRAELAALDWALQVIEAAAAAGLLEGVRESDAQERAMRQAMRGTAGS